MIPSNSALSPLLSKKTLQNHGCKENNHGSKENSYFKCTFNYNSKLIHHNNNLWKNITEGEGGMVERERIGDEKKREWLPSHSISEWIAGSRIYSQILLIYILLLVIHMWQWHQLTGRLCGLDCFFGIIASSYLCLLICIKKGHYWLLLELLVQQMGRVHYLGKLFYIFKFYQNVIQIPHKSPI